MPMRVAIVDDHSLFRQAIGRLLAGDREIQVVGEAGNGFDALTLARNVQPDVVLMDLYMPGLDGLEATRLIKRELPNVQVVLLSASSTEEDIVAAVHAGARGYISKTTDAADFIRQLKKAVAGGVALSEEAVSKLVSALASNKGGHSGQDREAYAALTSREKDVLGLIAQGKMNKEIAAALFVSVNTVRAHVRSLMQKLGLENRTQLAIYGLREGYGTEGKKNAEGKASAA